MFDTSEKSNWAKQTPKESMAVR